MKLAPTADRASRPPLEDQGTEALHEQAGADSRMSGERRERVTLAIFWLAVLIYAYFIPQSMNWNSESHLYPAYSFVDHHTFAIDQYQWGLGDKSYFRQHFYSDKAPGLTLVAIPAYVLFKAILGGGSAYPYLYAKHYGYYITFDMARLRFGITFLLVILPSAGLVCLLWLFMTHVTQRPGWSLAVAAAYAFGTPAFLYSGWFFSHQISAALLFASFLLLFWRVRGKPPDRQVSLMSGCAGLLAGVSIACEYPTAMIALLLGIYLFLINRSRFRSILAYAAGMAPAAVMTVYYNVSAFGAPFATGYMHVHSEYYHSNVHGGPGGLANPLAYGVQFPTWYSMWQITFGTYRGLFFICPVLLLAIPGAIALWRRHTMSRELWLFVSVVVMYFLIDASRGLDQNGWSGGASVTSRHLIPMLPFMAVLIAFGIPHRWFRVALVALGTVSVGIMTIIVSLTSFFTMKDQNLLANEAFPAFFSNRIGSNWPAVWWSSFGVTGWKSLVPLALVALLFTGRLWWLLAEPKDA